MAAIGGLDDYYLSSAEYDFISAWGQDFASGGQGNGFKDFAGSVLAVRAF